jgi:hypothetical protein
MEISQGMMVAEERAYQHSWSKPWSVTPTALGQPAGLQVGQVQGALGGLSVGFMQFVMFNSYALALWYGAQRVAAGAYSGGDVLQVLIASLLGSFSLGLVRPCATGSCGVPARAVMCSCAPQLVACAAAVAAALCCCCCHPTGWFLHARGPAPLMLMQAAPILQKFANAASAADRMFQVLLLRARVGGWRWLWSVVRACHSCGRQAHQGWLWGLSRPASRPANHPRTPHVSGGGPGASH